jgi:hypothetical protein
MRIDVVGFMFLILLSYFHSQRTSTTVCVRVLRGKSNAAVTFTDAQSDGSFVIVHHMRVGASITGQGQRAIVEFLKSSK